MVVSCEEEGHGTCRITKLPDCIMESIVSLLPLKDAVNTILASPPDWKHLSHSSILTRRNLEFDYLNVFGSKYQLRYDVDQDSEFSRRVSKYLQQYQGNKVDSFKLRCYLDAKSCVSLDDWIRFATTKGVEKLHLGFGFLMSPHKGYVFPRSLHVGSNLNLKYLSLKECILRHPTTDCDAFNQLTTLSLKNVHFDQSMMANLFTVCALLESLTLYWCRLNGSHYPRRDACPLVAGDRLTHLKVLHCHEEGHTEISALNLASLEYHPFCNCRSFHMKAPQLSRIFFANSRQDKDDVDVNFVLDVVKAAPFLEELVIVVYGGDLSETNPRETRNNHSRFTNDHLRSVEMQNFRGNWYETELAVCILEISPKLEKLILNQHGRLYLGDGRFNELGRSYSEQQMGVVKEKLKGVKTDAQIIFLQ
ncbi:PREDICTED: putative F-box/FBD/LRR-repeat protein At4g03220-like [Fragaria vesca subsp. vesca]